MKLNKKNNIKLKIENVLTSSGNLIIVDKGSLLGEDFSNDASKNFLLTLCRFSGTTIEQMEIVKVIAKSGNNLTLERAVEPCPLNYNSSEMSQIAYEFLVGDFAFLNLTAGEINKLGEEIKNLKNLKVDKTDQTITKQGNSFNSANQLVKLESNGKLPALDGSNLTNIRTDTFNFSINYTAGENIPAGSFVRKGSKEQIPVEDYYYFGQYSNNYSLNNNVQGLIFINKMIGFFSELHLVGQDNNYSGLKIAFYKDSGYNQKLAESRNLNYENISGRHVYKFSNFNILDRNYNCNNKAIYYRIEGGNGSFYYFQLTNNTEYINFGYQNYNRSFYFYKIFLSLSEDLEKIYVAKARNIYEIGNIIGYVKNGVNINQNATVITDGYIDNINLSGYLHHIFLSDDGQISNNKGTEEIIIGEKVNNNIFRFIKKEEKIYIKTGYFEAYKDSENLIINHGLGRIPNSFLTEAIYYGSSGFTLFGEIKKGKIFTRNYYSEKFYARIIKVTNSIIELEFFGNNSDLHKINYLIG